MRDDGRRGAWILLLAIVGGMAVGAWLALWVSGLVISATRQGQPAVNLEGMPDGAVCLGGAEGDPTADGLQLLQAFAPEPPITLRRPEDSGSGVASKILLVTLPTCDVRRRAFLFIRPADPALCRALRGVELAVHWTGAEPTAVCAVGDPPAAPDPLSAVEFFLG